MAVATEREYGLFINGEIAEPASGELRELTEPATGEPLAQGGRRRTSRTSTAPSTPPAPRSTATGAAPPPTERSRLLHALADALVANRKELAELEARNVGKAISSVKAELAQAVENFRFYGSAIASIAGRSNPVGGSLLFYSLKEPVGVCGQIVPWNYPLMMTTWKLAPALAAGCTIVLKPDSATPLSALRMAELATEVGFPPGTINVVPGPGPTVGAHLVRHPGVEKVAFTGSTATGGRDHAARLRRDQAADPRARRQEPEPRLRRREPRRRDPELGLVDLLLGRPELRGALARARRAARSTTTSSRASPRPPQSLKVGDPLDPETQVGSLISNEHRDRVHGYVETGREEGAEVVTGGEPADGKGAFYPPTVLAQVDNSMRVAQEEIFGPVVTVIPFEDEKDATRIANDVRYGLMATVWTGDPGRGHRLARRIKAGTVGINMPFTAFPGIPFGGYKQSGFGRELGLETLDDYLETKSVIVSTSPKPFNPFGL